MKPSEKYAILKAVENAAKDQGKELREIIDEELYDLYDNFGTVKTVLRVGEETVGEHIISFSSEGYEVTNQGALEEFALDYGFAEPKRTIKADKYEEAVKILEAMAPELLETKIKMSNDWDKGITYIDGECTYLDSGMIIPGIKYVPRKPKNTTIRGCKPDKVLPAVKRLGGLDQLLLEGE